MTDERTSRCLPYPELVEVEPGTSRYEIVDSRSAGGRPDGGPNGMVDLRNRRIHVPLEPRARPIVRHENGHVRWSPTDLPECDVPPMVLLAVEDARINLGLARTGVPVHVDALDRARIAALGGSEVADRRWVGLALRSIASIGTNAVQPLRAVLELGPDVLTTFVEELLGWVQERLVEAAGDGPVADFSVVIDISRDVNRRLEAYGLEVPKGRPTCCLAVSHTGGDGAPDTDEPALRLGRLPARGNPGRLSIAEPLLNVIPPRPTLRGARRWRPAGEGSVMRYVHRELVDGRVFRRAVRATGGTILIDTSGSMSLSASDVDDILAAAHCAVKIAMYSGRGGEGELRVIASHGRRAHKDDLKPFGSGNVVDLPALEWLAREAGPRVWISDGGVTGINDMPSPELQQRCTSLCKRMRVTRVPDVAAAVDGRRGALCGTRGGPRARALAWPPP